MAATCCTYHAATVPSATLPGSVVVPPAGFPTALLGLLRPEAYPHTVTGLRVVETHMSWVLLTGEYVYKLKRPVRFPFADFSDPAHRAHLCAGTHDYTRADFPLLRTPITIGAQAWVCADAFVGPGVAVGEGTIVAARAVAVKDAGPWIIVAGNPAREIASRPRPQ